MSVDDNAGQVRSVTKVSLRELAGASFALTAVAALTLGRYVIHGGFFSDDWADAAGRFYTPGGATLGHILHYYRNINDRLALVIYTPLKYSVFGTHIGWHIAWSVALGVVAATELFAVLRKLAFSSPHALVIALLVLLYPWSDALRLWVAASPQSLSIVFGLGGILAAMSAVERGSSRLHIASASLYVASLLTYELTLPLIAAAGVLYVMVAGWKRARARWAFDIGLAAAAGVWVRLTTKHGLSRPSTALTHAGEILRHGPTIAARTIDPLSVHSHGALLGVTSFGLVLAAFVAELRSVRSGRPWLLMVAGGLAIAILGWLAFVPADSYYTPTVFGTDNRVNGIAGIGLSIAAYGLFGLAAWLVGVVIPKTRRAVPVVTVVLGLTLAGVYAHVLERHIDIWQAAARSQETLTDRLHAAFPVLPAGSTVFTTDFPGYRTFGVPIFGATWDLNGRVKFLYKDGTISGYPIFGDESLVCETDGVGVTGGASTPTVRYGMAFLFNVRTEARAVPGSLSDCAKAIGDFPAGLVTLRGDY